MHAAALRDRVGDLATRLFRRRGLANASAPRIRVVRKYAYGPLLLEGAAPAGLEYALQATTGFERWQTVQTGRSAGEWFEIVDSAAANVPCRFYRILAGGICSSTVIGYVSVFLPPGHALIANPLVGPSDSISTLLPHMPEGARLSRFDPLQYQLTENTVRSGRWQYPQERLEPGQGAIFFNPTSESMTRCFAGRVITEPQVLGIAAGFSLRSPLLPLSGRLDTELGLPVAAGDAIHLFDPTKQVYAIHTYGLRGWEPTPPILKAGESFWVAKQASATWAQHLVLHESL